MGRDCFCAFLITITADEGQEAINSGTFGDPDGDLVTLTASVGTVVDNYDGAWSWSFETADGPAQSQTVTITADDGNGGTATVNFDLTVNNVAQPSMQLMSPLNRIEVCEIIDSHLRV